MSAPAPSLSPALEAVRQTSSLPDPEQDVADAAALLDLIRRPAPGWLLAEEHGANPFEGSLPLGSTSSYLEGVRAAFAALLGTPQAVVFQVKTTDFFPTWQERRPRLGLRQGLVSEREPGGAAGEAVYRCGLTGRAFALPEGAAVPALFYDTQLSDGSDPAGESWYCEARSHVVHPALVLAGPAAVLRAVWNKAVSHAEKAAYELGNATAAFTLAAGYEPEDVNQVEIAAAFRRWEPVDEPEAGSRAVPAGWRDVPPGEDAPKGG